MPNSGNPRRGWNSDSLGREPVEMEKQEKGDEPPQGGETTWDIGSCDFSFASCGADGLERDPHHRFDRSTAALRGLDWWAALFVHGLTPEATPCRPLRGLFVRHGARITEA